MRISCSNNHSDSSRRFCVLASIEASASGAASGVGAETSTSDSGSAPRHIACNYAGHGSRRSSSRSRSEPGLGHDPSARRQLNSVAQDQMIAEAGGGDQPSTVRRML